MGRTVAFAVVLGAVVAGQAQGQSSIGVTAVIVEPVTAGPVSVDVRSEAGRLSVVRSAAAEVVDSRVLRHAYVRSAEPVVEEGVGARTRGAASWQDPGRRLMPGLRVVEDAVDLTVTTVLAANS